MIHEISKDYFIAPATRDSFIELPPKDAEPGMAGKFEKSLYGTHPKLSYPWATRRVCPAFVVFITPSGI